MPNFSMQCFVIPDSLSLDIENMMQNIWWDTSSYNRKIHWLAWKRMREVKEVSDLGFEDYELLIWLLFLSNVGA